MRVLIVEDEPRLLRALAKAMREQGYAVDTASDGAEGLFKARETDYDVVVLDVMMPELDGWQVLEKLREEKTTPVLMLTARDSTSDRVKGLDGGADDYLVKPFELDELFARTRALIRRQGGQAKSVLSFGGLEIDQRARTVHHDGGLVALTAREFAILEYLALHRGKVISRTELYEHLFDENEDTLSNLLDVHVHGIRRKIFPELITTRRGEGYLIE